MADARQSLYTTVKERLVAHNQLNGIPFEDLREISEEDSQVIPLSSITPDSVLPRKVTFLAVLPELPIPSPDNRSPKIQYQLPNILNKMMREITKGLPLDLLQSRFSQRLGLRLPQSTGLDLGDTSKGLRVVNRDFPETKAHDSEFIRRILIIGFPTSLLADLWTLDKTSGASEISPIISKMFGQEFRSWDQEPSQYLYLPTVNRVVADSASFLKDNPFSLL